ncbi:sugar phosphate isomerase/epimerase [Pelagibacterales bacterium SAG-MED37]|nr:sugar phosphate isomerase/epimerase [Pelagibacterales bacterium SAG-MED37]
MICISTGQFKGINTSNLIKKLYKNGIENIELSAGNYEKNIEKKIISLKKEQNLFLHNYFPRPQKDFILNLCSTNPKIRKKSYEHVINGINLSSKIKAKCFSFHAGFLLDPNILEIGKKFTRTNIRNKSDAIKDFIKIVNKLAKYAKNKNIILLIENNVVTSQNLKNFKKNPLLMTGYKDAIKIMNKTADNVYLLLDVAHLKVSSKTLGFSKTEFIKKCNKWIKVYHLSDNNGEFDTNDDVKNNSWFWKYLKKDAIYYSLEIKFKNIMQLKKQIKITLSNLGKS